MCVEVLRKDDLVTFAQKGVLCSTLGVRLDRRVHLVSNSITIEIRN